VVRRRGCARDASTVCAGYRAGKPSHSPEQHRLRGRDSHAAHERSSSFGAPLMGSQKLQDQDLAEGFGRVYLPDGLERKYPTAHQEWVW
jgi:hypothetical protein